MHDEKIVKIQLKNYKKQVRKEYRKLKKGKITPLDFSKSISLLTRTEGRLFDVISDNRIGGEITW